MKNINELTIFFCHNTHYDLDFLDMNIKRSMFLFKNSFYFLFSDGEKISYNHKNCFCYNHNKKLGHKIGCTKGFFKTLGMSQDFYNKTGITPDAIVFAHDDVSISNFNLFEKALNNTTKDIYFREIINDRFSLSNKTYTVFDSIILRPSVYKKVNFNNVKVPEHEKFLPKDKRKSPCPEIFVGDFIKNNLDYTSIKSSEIIQGSINEFGFYHIKKPRKV